MTSEMFEFVDRDYGQCVRENPSRQIKTRRISFNNIYDKFTNFIRSKIDQMRIKGLENKLDKKIEDTFKEHYTESNFEEKIAKNADVIARLEEKIKFLSKEEVPANYAARRAIKLRQAMMSNLELNSRDCYIISRENYVDPGLESDDNGKDDEPVLISNEEMKAAAIPSGETDDIDVVQNPVNREEIVDAINSSFEEAKDDQIAETDDQPVLINKEEVRNAVEEAFNRLKEEKDSDVADINDSVDREIERIRVSRNNSRAVDSAKYDENGNVRRREYDYTPMTDEEIRESQIKLGFDENGNLLPHEKKEDKIQSLKDIFAPTESPVRDLPVVVKEREPSSLGLDLDDGQNMFEIVNQEDNVRQDSDFESTISSNTDESIGMSIDAYTALKEKILLLQKQKEESQQSRLEAQRRAEESAAKVQDARKQVEMTQASYNERLQKLRDYAASLEADYNENIRFTKEAEKNAEENEAEAQKQISQADKTRRIIGEIDSMFTTGDEEKQETALRVV